MSAKLVKGFLNDIVANIDDDLPRLAFADWLAEHGHDDRAELIRVQVELARLPAWDGRRIRLRLREQALLKQHGEAWLAEMPAIDGAKWEGFRRGIVAEVSFANFETMRAQAHACRAVAPVEAVTVRWPRRQEKVKSPDPIAELRELSLTGRSYNVDQIAWLADSPQLATLRVLTARGLWQEGMERFLASPHLSQLKAFHLPSNNLGNAGIRALTQAASLTNLEELTLSGRLYETYGEDPTVQAVGMQALAAWPGLASLRSLSVTGSDVRRAGLRALLTSPHVAGLKALALRGGRLEGGMLVELHAAVAALRLEKLDLGENVLKELGAEYIATAPCLRELKELRIDRCEVPLAGARVLAKKAKFLNGLCLLEAGHNHFSPAGLEALLQREPAELHTLGLRDNDLLDRGAALLADSPASDGLLEVDLSLNGIQAAGARALGAAEHLQGLLVLTLGDNKFSEADAAALASSPLGQRLGRLELKESPAEDDDFDDEDEDMDY